METMSTTNFHCLNPYATATYVAAVNLELDHNDSFLESDCPSSSNRPVKQKRRAPVKSTVVAPGSFAAAVGKIGTCQAALYLDGLRWDANLYVVGLDIFRCHRARPKHGILADLNAG